MQLQQSKTQEQEQPQTIEKNIIIKNCAQFTDYISGKIYIQIINTEDIDIVMQMYNLIASGSYGNTKKMNIFRW